MFGSSGSPAMYSVGNITLVEEQTNVVNHKYLRFPVGLLLCIAQVLKHLQVDQWAFVVSD